MELVQITPLPQLVPSRICLSCDVCCRFPEADSFLRPYFTAEEVRYAVARGIDPQHFPNPAGGQVAVVPNPAGDGYFCPAFDPSTSYCRIYDVRPLDCQLYPFTVMWSRDGAEVVLGWDAKCPFLQPGVRREALGVRREPGGEREAPLPRTLHASPFTIQSYAERIARLVEREEYLDTFIEHPALVARFQDDVTVIRVLPRLTERLVRRPHILKPLTRDDWERWTNALAQTGTPLSAYHLAPHLVWRSLFSYRWAELAGHLCLFAENSDGMFMPLPPLPLHLTPHASRLTEAIGQAMKIMRERNHRSAVTRIENIPEELKPELEALGYRLIAKDWDYLYRASDLANLKGDRYKSQRAACNRFARSHQLRYEPYRDEYRDACLTLFADWAAQQTARPLDESARHMLRDCEAAHREALVCHEALKLVGRVVWVDGAVRAYTFGYERPASVFCVLFEVADRTIAGLAQFIFREVCREGAERGYAFINTMDDSGLPTLARSKMAYRPVRLLSSYIATER
jgi:Fe-S-cluster containining protein